MYVALATSVTLWKLFTPEAYSDGGYMGIYRPKSVQVNFLWGKNDVRTAIGQFYTPKKRLYPQNKFLATPLVYSTALCE